LALRSSDFPPSGSPAANREPLPVAWDRERGRDSAQKPSQTRPGKLPSTPLAALLAAIGLLLFAGLFAVQPASAGILQLTNNSSDSIAPKINDLGQVVWQGWDGNN